MLRTIDSKELVYDRMGDRFETALSDYDTLRRVETLIDDFLPDELISDRQILDVGCGLGFFSKRLTERGGRVTATDIGPSLVEKAKRKAGCDGVVADACNLTGQFGEAAFDLVVSSECIEHTPSPEKALQEMAGVVRPGGYLAVSTPNVVWYPVVRAATLLKMRPFEGFENFSSWRGMTRTLTDAGMTIEKKQGLHLFPFQFGMHGLSRWCDNNLQFAKSCMLNICILAKKA